MRKEKNLIIVKLTYFHLVGVDVLKQLETFFFFFNEQNLKNESLKLQLDEVISLKMEEGEMK